MLQLVQRMRDPLRRLLRARRQLPLWARWSIAISAYVVAIAVIVLVVHSLASEGSGSATKAEVRAVNEANEVGKVAIAQNEAPHSALAPAGQKAGVALQRAIAADVQRRIGHGELTGPLQRVGCVRSGSARAGALLFRCTVKSAGIDYEFRGVARARGQLTWCKLDMAPEGDAALEVPLSPQCLR